MKYKLIGIYELVTGIFGAVLLIFITLQKILEKSTQVLPSALLGLLLFLGLAFSGYGLIKKKKYGRKYSLWLQGLQIIGFTFNSIQYIFTTSAFLALVIDSTIHVQTKLALIDYNIDRVSVLFPLEIRIYILPVILLLLLLKK